MCVGVGVRTARYAPPWTTLTGSARCRAHDANRFHHRDAVVVPHDYDVSHAHGHHVFLFLLHRHDNTFRGGDANLLRKHVRHDQCVRVSLAHVEHYRVVQSFSVVHGFVQPYGDADAFP